MWKREDTQDRPEPRPERPAAQDMQTSARSGRGERATIGPSISIRGDVTGDEDLLIQGRVEGSVQLEQHMVTIGPQGQVKADISARVVTVEGTVEGNLRADEQVVLRGSARVLGDIVAPRVMLEDGAYFRGGVDMGEHAGRAQAAARPSSTPAAAAAQQRGRTGTGADAQAEAQAGPISA
jgi:cytoskeletal protein CcmA (bactofilin family)